MVKYSMAHDDTNIGILHSGSKAQDRGIPETMAYRILMFMWSLEPRVEGWQQGCWLSLFPISRAVFRSSVWYIPSF